MKNQFMRKYLFLLSSFLFIGFGLNAQIINTKGFLSFSAGKVIFWGPDDLFFPKGMNNSGISFRADYLNNILPWMKIGAEGSMVLPGLPVQGGSNFSKITSNNEKIMSIGVNATFFLPYKETGWRNRLRLQFGVAPVIVVHNGERIVTIDNRVLNTQDQRTEGTSLMMKGPKTGFGLSFTPSLEYYVAQRVGIRLSYNSLLASFKSDLTTENVIISSLNFGVFMTLSRNKQFNY
jgi:hypothetical protein